MILDNCRLRNILPTLPEDVRDSIEAMFEGYADMVEEVRLANADADLFRNEAKTLREALEAHKAAPAQASEVQEPRKIKSKYKSFCTKCQGPVSIDQWIYWTPGVKGVIHIEGECV